MYFPSPSGEREHSALASQSFLMSQPASIKSKTYENNKNNYGTPLLTWSRRALVPVPLVVHVALAHVDGAIVVVRAARVGVAVAVTVAQVLNDKKIHENQYRKINQPCFVFLSPCGGAGV